MATKIIFITGGVMSGIGKGIVTSSIGMLLKTRGFNVKVIKCDPYLCVDPGTMNPYEHGEVFVTDKVWSYEQGGNQYNIAELDQDFGNYERFLDIQIHPSQNVTSGQIFLTVLNRERDGGYLGQTVQMIPHVTDEIKSRIEGVIDKENPEDFLLIEIGGTTGDIEGELYLETARQLLREYGKERVILVHVTWVPYNQPVNEFKTKPSQHSMSLLYARGLFPEFIVCRSEKPIDDNAIEKIALYGNLKKERIIKNENLDNIYHVPLKFEEQNLCSMIISYFNLNPRKTVRKIVDELNDWEELTNKIKKSEMEVNVAVAGKYTANLDAYYSIREALIHGGVANNVRVNIDFIDVETVNKDFNIDNYDGILVPGGFGERGAEEKITIATKCIEKKKPYLGICFGMQLGLVAIARNLCDLKEANSFEVNKNTPHPVINFVEGQKDIKRFGGTMRLGSYTAELKENTIVYNLYGNKTIKERHRHRLEVNPEYIEKLENCLIVSGVAKDDHKLIEFIELPTNKHPFFVGTQAHPEFNSRINKPSPLYKGFIKACKEEKNNS